MAVIFRVDVAIRLLAEASYLNMLEHYGMHKTTLYSCLWYAVDDINTLVVGDIIVPGTQESCKELDVDSEVGRNPGRQSY